MALSLDSHNVSGECDFTNTVQINLGVVLSGTFTSLKIMSLTKFAQIIDLIF